MVNREKSLVPEGFLHARALPKGFFQELEELNHLIEKFQNEFLNLHLQESQKKNDTDSIELDFKVLEELNRRNFFSLWLPKFLGGQGFHPLTMNLFNEKIGGQCLGVANIVGAHYFGFGLLALSHNYKIMKQITSEIREGEIKGSPCLLSAAVTEPTAGTDRENMSLLKKAQLSCWAEKTQQGYVLNGRKLFISNAIWARYHIVVTTTQKSSPDQETLILAVPSSTNGITVSSPLHKWGQKACPASEIIFNDCLITTEFVALQRDDFSSDQEFAQYSLIVTDNLLAQSRAAVASLAAGVCQYVLNKVESHLASSHDRNQEWLQSKVAELIKNARLSRLLAWESGLVAQYSGPQRKILSPFTYLFLKYLSPLLSPFMKTKKFSHSMKQMVLEHNMDVSLGLSSLAKFSTTDMAHQAALIGLEILGSDLNLEKTLRDCKLLQIYEGTNQLNRLQCFFGLANNVQVSQFEEPQIKNEPSWKPELNVEKIELMRTAFQILLDHSLQRKQGGRTIIDWSEHRKVVTHLQLQIENYEFLLKSSITTKEQIRLSILLNENFISLISQCLQMMGGKGYLYSSGIPDILNRALKLRAQSPALEKQILDYYSGAST